VSRITPVVKILLIVTIGIWFFAQLILENFLRVPVTAYLSLIPGRVITNFEIWRLGTYLFLHSLEVNHILFNMLTLWLVGTELEQRWGKKFFLQYYFGTGIGAALLYTLCVWGWGLATGSLMGLISPVVGASASLFGLMMAYAILFGEREVAFMMVFPMKAKYLVAILAFIQIASLLASVTVGSGVAYLAHIGGLVVGYLILWLKARSSNRASAKKASAKGNLRLIVDNEKNSSKNSGSGPRYWN
jgi:membrane associated rhomboid family serine protease